MSMFQVERRQREGAKPKQLRKKGLLPMALVERTHETTLIQAPVDQLREAMRHVDGHGALQLQIEGESTPRKAIVKHVEQDALKRELIHVTLQEVSDDDPVKLEVPIVLRGHPESEGQGVTLTQVLTTLKVRGRLRDMPEHIDVDVSQLAVGGHIEVGQLSLPENVECQTDAHATIATLSYVREPDTTVPNETEAETGEIGAGGTMPSGQGVPSEDGP